MIRPLKGLFIFIETNLLAFKLLVSCNRPLPAKCRPLPAKCRTRLLWEGYRRPSSAPKWALIHPEHWDKGHVTEWLQLTVTKYAFHTHIASQLFDLFKVYDGPSLLALSLLELKRKYGVLGEIVYTALQQILDMAPGHEERSQMYADKIRSLLKSRSYDHGRRHQRPALWQVIPTYQWTPLEIHDWFQVAAQQLCIRDSDKERLVEDLTGRTGVDLCSLQREDFVRLSAKYGERIYRHLHNEIAPDKRRRHQSD